MADFQVTCITPDSLDTDQRIDALGGYRQDGSRWYDTIDNVITAVRNGNTFWVSVNGRRVNVFIRIHPVSFRPFLTTDPDGYQPNNLLSLPQCA